MTHNEGSTDRILRVIAGIAVIGAGVYYGSWWGAVGIVPLATAAMGWCPLYSILGVNTCKKTN